MVGVGGTSRLLVGVVLLPVKTCLFSFIKPSVTYFVLQKMHTYNDIY